MRILIAYDGSLPSRRAIEELSLAGLPEHDVRCRVLAVGEFVFPVDSIFHADPNIPLVSFTVEKAQELTERAMEAADGLAADAVRRLREEFPNWTIESWARLNSPASTILDVARDWKADLIVLGSHGRSLLGRLTMGSVSARVVSELPCSVRVVRPQPAENLRREQTLLLAFDDSAGARAALREVMRREWPNDTNVHVVTVADVTLLAALDYVSISGIELLPSRPQEETRLMRVLHSVEHELQKRFRTVTGTWLVGTPTEVILREAKRVSATQIFLGSRGLSRSRQILLGSVGHGVVLHADCTVEIVKAPTELKPRKARVSDTGKARRRQPSRKAPVF